MPDHHSDTKRGMDICSENGWATECIKISDASGTPSQARGAAWMGLVGEVKQKVSLIGHLAASPVNGLVIDKTEPDWPASIAATGLAVAAYPVGLERGFVSRAVAVKRTLANPGIDSDYEWFRKIKLGYDREHHGYR